MTDLPRLTRFTMGAAIPEWLLTSEPEQPGAPRGNFRFAVDVEVFETDNTFTIVPLMGGPYPIDMSGMKGHKVYATAKEVRMVTAWGGFGTLANQQWGHILPGMWQTPALPGPTPTPDGPVPPVEPPKPGYWARLWQALKG